MTVPNSVAVVDMTAVLVSAAAVSNRIAASSQRTNCGDDDGPPLKIFH